MLHAVRGQKNCTGSLSLIILPSSLPALVPAGVQKKIVALS